MPEEISGDVLDISAGSRHTFIIEMDGKAYATGFIESAAGYYGHMGLGPVKERQDCKKPNKEFCVEAAGKMGLLQIAEVVDAKGKTVAAPPFKRAYGGVGVPADTGGMHAVLISEDGRVYISGNNNKYQLCLGDAFDEVDFVDTFHEVPGIKDAETAAVGDEFTLIRTSDDKVFGCGTNQVGQIGQGDSEFSNEPVRIEGMGSVVDMSVGLRFSIFLDSKGKVWGTGSNIYGQQCFYTEGAPTRNVAKVRFLCCSTNHVFL